MISVAPRAGAWIEIESAYVFDRLWTVAPRAGAWIEIESAYVFDRLWTGRSPCGSVD